jgi:DNA-damage-inducible protein J
MSECVIRSRIDPNIKEKAIQLFEQMGLTLSEAIRLFIYQAVAEKRIPFSVNVPNAITKAALEEAHKDNHLEKTSLKKLMQDWKDACDK